MLFGAAPSTKMKQEYGSAFNVQYSKLQKASNAKGVYSQSGIGVYKSSLHRGANYVLYESAQVVIRTSCSTVPSRIAIA